MTMNLYEYIRSRPRMVPSDTVCRLMYQLVKALEYLHRYGSVLRISRVAPFGSRYGYFHRDVS